MRTVALPGIIRLGALLMGQDGKQMAHMLHRIHRVCAPAVCSFSSISRPLKARCKGLCVVCTSNDPQVRQILLALQGKNSRTTHLLQASLLLVAVDQACCQSSISNRYRALQQLFHSNKQQIALGHHLGYAIPTKAAHHQDI